MSSKRHHLHSRVIRPFKDIRGRCFWSQSKGHVGLLLVINSNLGPILHPFLRHSDLVIEHSKISPPLSCLPPSVGVIPLEFLEKLYGADSEDFVILACVVLIGQQGVTDGRTDGRTLLP